MAQDAGAVLLVVGLSVEVVEVEGSAKGRQRKILQARALGLLDDELLDQAPPGGDPAA